MNNFVFTTDVSQDITPLTDGFPKADAYFMVYVKDEMLDFKAYHKEGHENDLITLIANLGQEALMEDILGELPEIVPNGESLVEDIIDRLSMGNCSLEEFEDSPILQPADLFGNSEHNHTHED